jgi:hypothetical protein
LCDIFARQALKNNNRNSRMPKVQATFDLVCLYAKSRDRKKIENLIDQEKLCIDFRCGNYTPIMYLAELGDYLAVKVMLSVGASHDSAVEGYARGGWHHGVQRLIEEGAKVGFAARGYASVGNDAEVAKLKLGKRPYHVVSFEKQGRLLFQASKQAGTVSRSIADDAIANDVEVVTLKISQAHGVEARELTSDAVYGFAVAGNIDQVNKLVLPWHRRVIASEGESAWYGVEAISSEKLINAYRDNGHFSSPEKLLRVAALTDSVILRGFLLAETPTRSLNSFGDQVRKLRSVMLSSGALYHEARLHQQLLAMTVFKALSCHSKFSVDICLYIYDFLATEISPELRASYYSRFFSAPFRQLESFVDSKPLKLCVTTRELRVYLAENNLENFDLGVSEYCCAELHRFFSLSNSIQIRVEIAVASLAALMPVQGSNVIERETIESTLVSLLNDPSISARAQLWLDGLFQLPEEVPVSSVEELCRY